MTNLSNQFPPPRLRGTLMAKQTMTPSNDTSSSRRKRRSPEEMIADLQLQIEEVKQRAAARQMTQTTSVKMTVAVVRQIDKALELAPEEGQTVLRHALADSRKPLASFLSAKGIKLPKARVPRGRKPKEYSETQD